LQEARKTTSPSRARLHLLVTKELSIMDLLGIGDYVRTKMLTPGLVNGNSVASAR
jgi:hypothetical protein